MKGVIMAGGFGNRLRPMTCTIPKPMVPLMDAPVMEHSINLLKRHGITEIAVTLQYLPNAIMDYFGDGSDFGVHICYFLEDTPMGTAGSVKNAASFLDEDFVVVSGDALTDLDITNAVAYHKNKNAFTTLVLKRVPAPVEYGVVLTDEAGRITRFLEKPDWPSVFGDTANTGIYIMNKDILQMIPEGISDFAGDIFPMLLQQKYALFGLVTMDYWCDVGDTHFYTKAHEDALNGVVQLGALADAYIAPDAVVAPNAVLIPPYYIAAKARVDENAHIGPYAVIGKHSYVAAFARIKNSVLWYNAAVHKNAMVHGSVLCNHSIIGKNCILTEGAVIGEQTKLAAHCVVSGGAKIWPNKHIPERTKIAHNLIWGAANGLQCGGCGWKL